MKRILVPLLIAAIVVPVLGSSTAFAKKEAAPPSFKPGAEVTLAITIKAPRQWKLNHLMPLTLSFDEEYLKDAPFSVKESSYTIKLDHYLPRLTVAIPVELNGNLEDGRLRIPLSLIFSICNEVTEFCAFSVETVNVPVYVQAKAGAGEKNQALDSGTAEHSHLLSIP